MRFLITGGAGFIGSHLAESLLGSGHRVHVLDDLSTGSMDNVRHFESDRRFGYTIDTCACHSVVAELVDEADVVYHLAAAVGVKLVLESAVRTIETNVHCTEIVLAAAARRHTPVFVASTSEVYGRSTDFPFREDGDLVFGSTSTSRWSYGCSKAIDEFLALAYWKERGLPTVVGRLFNTVGPRQTGRHGMVVPSFVQRALTGLPLRVHGDGTQTRCFCHVDDVVRGLVGVMELGAGAHGEIFNIGAQEEISILSLAERVRELTGSDSPIEVVPYEEAYAEGFADMPRRYPDLTKIGGAIGWSATLSLDEILLDVIAFQRAQTALV
jgi:UDP-glucose 4-epimerase